MRRGAVVAAAPTPGLTLALALALALCPAFTAGAEPKPGDAPPGLTLKAADHLRHRGETKQAAPLYRALREQPGLSVKSRARAAYFLGFCEEAEGRFESAFEVLRDPSDRQALAGLKLSPTDPLAPRWASLRKG